MLETLNLSFSDKHLTWGAKLSSYSEELNRLPAGVIPVFIELNLDQTPPAGSVIIDHHNQSAGMEKSTSIEQFAELLGISLTRWQKLIAANDRGWIPELLRAGASPEEIASIRAYDRKCQGVTEEEESAAKAISESFVSSGKLDVLIIHLIHTSPYVDQLYGKCENLLIITPQTVNFFGWGEIVEKLGREFPGSWYGGNLPETGFWGVEMTNLEEVEYIKAEINGIIDGS